MVWLNNFSIEPVKEINKVLQVFNVSVNVFKDPQMALIFCRSLFDDGLFKTSHILQITEINFFVKITLKLCIKRAFCINMNE